MYVSCCDYLLAVKIYNKQLPKITPSQTSQPSPIAIINFSWPLSSTRSIFEQALNTLHRINRAKLFTENSGFGISLQVGGQLTPKIYSIETQ